MFHYYQALISPAGGTLPGYFARVIDPDALTTVDIYADDAGTPITSSSGVTNMAKSDDAGNLRFYVDPGTYHLDIYGTDAISFQRRIPNVGMGADYSGPTGADQIGYGARTAGDKLTDVPSALDGMSASAAAAYRARSSSTEFATALQARLDAVSAAGGGVLTVPAGKYPLGSTVEIPHNVVLRGVNNGFTKITGPARGTMFEINHNGDAFKSVAPINEFTPVNNGIEDCSIYCVDPASSTGAAYYDQGGTYVRFCNNFVNGFRDGLVLDQTEQALISHNRFYEQKRHSAWAVRGPDFNVAHTSGQWTNRILWVGNEFNQPLGWCMVIDGSLDHTLIGNNMNGGTLGHLRIAGFYTNVTIIGGEWEGAGGDGSLLLSDRTVTGNFIGEKSAVVTIQGGHFGQPVGKHSIKVVSGGSLSVIGCHFDGTVAAMTGLENLEQFFEAGCSLGIGGGLTLLGTGRPGKHFSGSRRFRFSVAHTLPVIAHAAQDQAVFANSAVAAGDRVTAAWVPTTPGAMPYSVGQPIAEAGQVRLIFTNNSGAGAGGQAGTWRFTVEQD